MTDDRALLAFLEAARETRTKVVMVGDHRQLSAVGPGVGRRPGHAGGECSWMCRLASVACAPC